jgi:hypothetical protein
MAEHPIVTVTPAQYERLAPFFAYELTPELNQDMMAWATILLETALALVLLERTPQQAQALESLENASAWTQQALIRGKGIPHPPAWLHVAEETP